jgi:hypothetical protein
VDFHSALQILTLQVYFTRRDQLKYEADPSTFLSSSERFILYTGLGVLSLAATLNARISIWSSVALSFAITPPLDSYLPLP